MSLKYFILRRILETVPLILGVVVMSFILINLAPGDVAIYLAGPDVPIEYMERLRVEFGLDKPLLERLLIYVSRVFSGNLGYSFKDRMPVLNVIWERLPNTLLLLVSSLTFAVTLGVLLGIYSSMKVYSITDTILSILSPLGYSLPGFWLALLLMLTFSIHLDLFPVQGMYTVGVDMSSVERVIDVIMHLFLPMMCLGLPHLALYTRLTRANMIETLHQDYIVTARAKGCSERCVIFNHALKNAILPIVTILGLQIGMLFMGAVVIESVFAWPGVGRLLYDSMYSRDYPVSIGIFIVVSIAVIISNLVVDLIYFFIDPRIRY